jgi:hypothetical protein
MTREPALLTAAILAVIDLVVLLVFGHKLNDEETAAILAVVTALGGLVVRSQVSPVT